MFKTDPLLINDPRLAVWVLLNTDPAGFFALLAVVSTSFSAVNAGTHQRSPATPYGNTSLPHVKATLLENMYYFLFF